MYEQEKWDLTAILESPEGAQLDIALESLETAAFAIEAVRPRLTSAIGGEDFSFVLRLIEKYAEAALRLGSYGPLWFSEDTKNARALSFMGRMEQALAETSNRVLFFDLWWKSLDDATAARLLKHAGRLVYYLERERLFKDHTLTEPEEKIINLKDINGVNALVTVYDMLTSDFAFRLEVNGQTREMTRDELSVYVRDPSAAVREASYRELYRVYGAQAALLSQIYMHRVRDWAAENVGMRSFRSPLSVRNLINNIPDTVVETLLSVCAEKADVFRAYFRYKAERLGIEGAEKPRPLRRCDLYAPLKKESEIKIPYDRAAALVLDTFKNFSPEFHAAARRVFQDRAIDSRVSPGKRGGAFCYSVLPGLTPYVLVNYTGEPRQAATLAHELGHAVHALMAAGRSPLTFHAALPLAETASVFSEMLLTDRLLEEEKSPELQRDLLISAVDDAYATVLRQAFFVLYEVDAHRAISEGADSDALNRLYFQNLQRQFGDSVEVSDDFLHEWITIPHIFHTPFYCYSYSFGQLLSLALYSRYKEQGKAFVPVMLKILSYGNDKSPDGILREAGIDISDAGFWRSGFKVIEDMIARLG
jgi:oligoendopeptidase F